MRAAKLIFLFTFLVGCAHAATLSASRSSSGTPVDLNFFGTDDFAHWGRSDTNSFDHKNGANLISNLQIIAGPNGTLQEYTVEPVSFSWTGGTPTASAVNSATGLVVNNINGSNPGGGFSFTVPASTTVQTLRLWVGVFNDTGRLDVSLSDSSAPAIVDTSFHTGTQLGTTEFTIQFAANSSGQTLAVKWTAFNGTGSPTIQSAALASAPIPQQIRVALVGDEITAGAGIASQARAYPALLGTMLGNGYAVANFGGGNATVLGPGFSDSPFVVSPAYADSSVFAPQIVVILLGTNDSKPQNWANSAQFSADATALVNHYAALDSHPQVYLALPTPAYPPENFDVDAAVIHNQIVPLLRGVAEETGTPLIDIHAALSGRPDLFPDHVHPSEDGHTIIAQTIYSALSLRAPASLTASVVSATRVDLAWAQNTSNATGFDIERSTENAAFELIDSAAANATSFSDASASPLTQYTYRIRARNDAGQSPFSNTASATTPDAIPLPPSDLAAVSSSSSQIDLNWTDNSANENAFIVERSLDATAWTVIASLAAGQTVFHDTGLLAATMYSYRVRARNSAGDSSPSNVATTTTFSDTGRGNFVPVPGDSDGDGFSDALETAAGTSATNPLDTPTGSAAENVLPLADTSLAIKLNFAKPRSDSITLSGTVLLSTGFTLAGKQLLAEVGGVARAFTLDSRGTSRNEAGAASVKSKGFAARSAKFSVKLLRGQFSGALAAAGLSNATTRSDIFVPVSIVFAGQIYEVQQPQSYKAIAGKGGVTKDKR